MEEKGKHCRHEVVMRQVRCCEMGIEVLFDQWVRYRYISMYVWWLHASDNGQATSQLELQSQSCALQTKTPTRGVGIAQDVAAAADMAESKITDEAIVSELKACRSGDLSLSLIVWAHYQSVHGSFCVSLMQSGREWLSLAYTYLHRWRSAACLGLRTNHPRLFQPKKVSCR